MSRNGKKRTVSAHKAQVKQASGVAAPTPKPEPLLVDATPKSRTSWTQHALLIAVVTGLFLLGGAWLVDRFQGSRDTDSAKTAVMTSVSNVANEIGSFLELSVSRPDQIDALFAAHEVKMNELRAPLMAAIVALGARDQRARAGFEKMSGQLFSFDGCLARAYRGPDPAPRLQMLGVTYRSFTNNIATRLPRIAVGEFDDDQFLKLQCPP